MSENEILDEAKAPAPLLLAAPASQPLASRRQSFWWVFGAACILVLALGEAYLWHLDQVFRAGQNTQLAVLQAQVGDLRLQASRAQPAADSVVVQADLAEKFSALAAQVNAMQTQLAADHGTLTMLQANATDLTTLKTHLAGLEQLERLRLALDAGQKLGAMANAPPALAQFAATPPPTEAVLRLAFPDAARAAEAASVSGGAKASYWSHVVARLENLVTVSNGTHVLVGAPAAGVIEQARDLLNAGDLGGAVAQLDTLSVATQNAMSGWLDQARALLAARAALITMAGQD